MHTFYIDEWVAYNYVFTNSIMGSRPNIKFVHIWKWYAIVWEISGQSFVCVQTEEEWDSNIALDSVNAGAFSSQA